MAKAVRNFFFIAILILICNYTFQVFERKESINKYKPFLEQKEDFDVLLVGASHVRHGYYPMELWDDYGIVSYNFGNTAAEIAISYWNMMNALDYTDPKLVVFDVSRYGANRSVRDPETVHKGFDAFPLSLTKIRAVEDLMGEGSLDADGNPLRDRRLEILWNFELYHDRWGELKQSDFERTPNVEKGAISLYEVDTPAEFKVVPREKYTEINSTGSQYLRKAIEECQSRGIDILLTYIPATISKTRQKKINYVYLIAEEYGIEFLNFNHVEGLINLETDFNDSSDTNCHLNTSGAKKVTSYLGQYIKEHYDIPDRRNDADYAGWFQDYAVYVNKKEKAFADTQELDSYLAQIADGNYNISVHLATGADILRQKRLVRLLKNVSLYREPTVLDQAIEERAEYWLYVDNAAQEITESLTGIPEGMDVWEADSEAQLQIAVTNKKTGEIADLSEWVVSSGKAVRK